VDMLQRIFEPFYTTKRPGEGTGLGLSMAYGIVKQSGGYIFADSAPGEGARFSLYFPADPNGTTHVASANDDGAAFRAVGLAPGRMDGEGRALDAPVPSEDKAQPDCDAGTIRTTLADGSGQVGPGAGAVPRDADGQSIAVDMPGADGRARRPVVLLVEDEAPVRAFASRALRLRGYTVLEAANAEDALEMLEDGELEVDLFVTDVMMPGLDGPTWVRQALQDRPGVRTVFMSGYAQDALSETSTPVPNAVFLPKPFSLSDLTRTVERILQ
ncbi:MAG: response regulator, partial [Jannaschia sp.]